MPETQTHQLTHLSKKELIAIIYDRYGKRLYSYGISRWNLTEDDSWDIVYKTLYKTIEVLNNKEFESEEKLASYIFRIFLNYTRNHYRDHKKEHEFFKNSEPINDQLHKATESSDEKQSIQMIILNEELEKMEDWQRMLLLMRSEGMPYADIAKYIDKPINQLKVYYQRLKENISKRIHERL